MTDTREDGGAHADRHRLHAGQAAYTPATLRLYDTVVLGFSNRVLWRCPTRHLRALFDRNVSDRHLDIGVGTGYFLDRARFPDPSPAITLLDLNAVCLDVAARRIARYRPTRVNANTLEPLPVDGPFESVSLCYLLHCLPGAMADKAIVFDHVAAVLAPGAVVFGATIVQGDAPRSWAARRLMTVYNRKGVFSNTGDTERALREALEARFADVSVCLHGCVVLFEARGHG